MCATLASIVAPFRVRFLFEVGLWSYGIQESRSYLTPPLYYALDIREVGSCSPLHISSLMKALFWANI